jgi:hypothetical protein
MPTDSAIPPAQKLEKPYKQQQPDLVLRVGFAGSQDLAGDAAAHLRTALHDVLGTIGKQLSELVRGHERDSQRKDRVAKFYSKTCPVLRVVTGLCQGADDLAAEVLAQVQLAPEQCTLGNETCCLNTELAAVLPFDVETYRASRPADYRPTFDRRLEQCSYIIPLDGIYEKPDPPTALADLRRGKAYRNQSAVLLRQSDLLIAAADPSQKGKAGGTLETVREALHFDLPVVFIHTGTGKIYLIEPEQDWYSVLAAEPNWSPGELGKWVREITAELEPEIEAPVADDHSHATGHKKDHELLLEEYFFDSQMPPVKADGKGRRPTRRERIWNWFEKRFTIGKSPKATKVSGPYTSWRDRATSLNYHYSGLYRGAFPGGLVARHHRRRPRGAARLGALRLQHLHAWAAAAAIFHQLGGARQYEAHSGGGRGSRTRKTRRSANS